jgi:hypothetical protein
MLLAIFLTGVFLWLVGASMKKHDEKKREERVAQRMAEWMAWRDARDARWAAMIDDVNRTSRRTSR